VKYAPPIISSAVAAQQIIAVQYRIMTNNAAVALKRPDPTSVHDMRVAMNRLRAALGLFQPLLAGEEVESIARLLGDVRTVFGPARDAQLWVEFLNRLLREKSISNPSQLQQYVRDETIKMEQVMVDLQEDFPHDTFEAVCHNLRVLIERDFPRFSNTSSTCFALFSAGRIKKCFSSTLDEPDDTRAMSAEEMHQVRKRCKRLRYWAEFAAPVLDNLISELVLRAKTVTSAFGAVHDLDVERQLLKLSDFKNRAIVRDALHKARKTACHDAEKAWGKLRKRSFARTIQDDLTRPLLCAAIRHDDVAGDTKSQRSEKLK